MTFVDWRMKGKYIKNCNCAFGCPCDFNARPTQGHCEGMAGMEIDEGHFGDVPLDGLRWAANYHWPGALHEGNGTLLPIVDARADERQREALLTILSGKEQVEGTFFHILSLIVSTVLEPKFAPLEFEFSLQDRKARMSAPGVFDTTSEPIRNPASGEEHRILVTMPDGFEYRETEIASATARGIAGPKFDFAGRHSSLAIVEYTPQGLA